MNDLTVIRFAGRCFSSEDVALMCQAARDYASLGITEIARTVCEWLDWKRPNGRLKNHECRLLLERLRDQGVLPLPSLHRSGPRGAHTVAITDQSDAQPLIQTTVATLRPLRLLQIESGDSALFRQFIQRYHYLGYRRPPGANLRYFVQSGTGQVLACLQWSSPAGTMAARDQWIGWTSPQRARNLQYIVNNSRFLILPWVRVRDWHLPFWRAPPARSSTTGPNIMATSRCSWRLSSILFDSSEPAIVLPTGFVLEKLQDEDGWIAITEPASLRKPSSCFHCAGKH